jgi:membrane fusion protein (multidrug efflux system)
MAAAGQNAEAQIVAWRQGAEGGEAASAAMEAPEKRRKLPRVLWVSAIAVALALGGIAWILASPSAESTDDAYIAADTTSVAPRIRGFVQDVFVRDNQPVQAGDLLARIDPEEFDARVAAARADLANADADLASARAALVSLAAEQRLAAANVVATRTAIRTSLADATHAEADRQRYEALVATGAVARRDAETYRTAAVGAEQASARARAQLAVSQREAEVTTARQPTLEAAIAKADAARQHAQAALDLALQDQRHTLIRAPIAGVVGNRLVRVGDYVQPGSRLLTLVPMSAIYVTANFKETQTRDMHPGEAVTIDVDALGSKSLHGTVDSIAPGSGSTFALLPFEPGTGNFTKIVQRVPVRIRFDPGQTLPAALRPGLSVSATVHLAG